MSGGRFVNSTTGSTSRPLLLNEAGVMKIVWVGAVSRIALAATANAISAAVVVGRRQ